MNYSERKIHKVEVRQLKKYYDAKIETVESACHIVFQPFLPTDYARPECEQCFDDRITRRGSYQMAT